MSTGRLLATPLPEALGATITPEGVEFAVFSRHADSLSLCVFDDAGDAETARFVLPCRSGDIHHGLLPGAGAGLRYGLRAEGPWQPGQGHRFDPAKLLLDPYARAIDRPFRWAPELAAPPGAGIDTASLVPRGLVTAPGAPVAAPSSRPPALVYELAVKSFSMRHPAVPAPLRGTLAALGEPAIVDHLVKLGVSHVELMPVAAWMDERHLPPLGLANAWGYNPVNFFALDPRLAPGGVEDLCRLTRRYGAAGIAVILDIVFNHSAESDGQGGTVCLRGLDNAVYYRHAAEDPGQLVNDTGCGNTLACDEPVVVRMMMDSLRHWRACGVAGFRFDLAATLGRDATGFTEKAPFFSALAQDPGLAGSILVAEPWDIGPGGYQLGAFPHPFAEWNGRYRDDVRRFWRGDAGFAGALAERLAGSSDLFEARHRGPGASINFIASHDGFTLRDLVSYAGKHNEANGENNRDGESDSHSWNNGAEGACISSEVLSARRADIRALLATLFLSRGTPMLTAGDEFGRSQGGNNNAYAQDNEHFWLDWDNRDEGLAAFVAALSTLRNSEPALSLDRFFTGQPRPGLSPDVTWLTQAGKAVSMEEWPGLEVLLLLLGEEGEGGRLLLAFNRRRDTIGLMLPPVLPGKAWALALCSAGYPQTGPADTMPARSVRVYRES